MLLRGQLRAAAPAMPPVVLHTHLYATLKYVLCSKPPPCMLMQLLNIMILAGTERLWTGR